MLGLTWLLQHWFVHCKKTSLQNIQIDSVFSSDFYSASEISITNAFSPTVGSIFTLTKHNYGNHCWVFKINFHKRFKPLWGQFTNNLLK